MSSNQIKRIGRYWNSGGGTPDWAGVNANQQRSNALTFQLVSPTSTGPTAWVAALVATPEARAPPVLLHEHHHRQWFRWCQFACTERSPEIYRGKRPPTPCSFGPMRGEWIWANLTGPVLINIATGYAVGIAARDAGTSVGMIQAATLNALPVADRPHNTWFYDRATDGSGIPQNGYTSTVNAGNLAVVIEGEKNVAPTSQARW